MPNCGVDAKTAFSLFESL